MRTRTKGWAAILTGSLAMVAAPAAADEVWTTESGPVEYLSDVGTMAVLGVPQEGVSIFVEGLAGNSSNRGTFLGYWVDYEITGDDVTCGQAATDEYGNESLSWGFVQMTFLDPSYPGRWTMSITRCDAPEIVMTLYGKPL